MLMLVMGIFSHPSFQSRPSVSQAKHAYPNCRPILFDETHSGFENPSPSHLRMVGNTMGSQQDERTWEIPSLNSVSGTGHGTDASRFWRFGKPPFLVQKAAHTAVSLFSGRFTIQLPFANFFLQDCEKEQQLTSVLGLLGNPQLTGAPVQQNDSPAETGQAQSDEKTGAENSQINDAQAQARLFVGTVIDEEGANLRSGPGLDYAIVDKWAKGQQFPFEMVSADREWLRIDEGLWIYASIVAGQEISQTPFPAYGDSPEHPVPIIKASDLGQRVATQEGDKIFLGAVSVRAGANIRSGPGLEHEIVSPVSFGSLIAWVAMNADREWLYLQHGHWISADLVSESKVYRIINLDEAIGPVGDVTVTEISQEQISQTQGTGYIATVISESGADIRSGPGFEYALVATIPLGHALVYRDQSENGEWLLLEDGNWISALQISNQGFDGTPATVVKAEVHAEDLEAPAMKLEKQVALDPSFDLPALRQQALAYVNEARILQGLSPVRLGENQAAQKRTAEMIQQRYLSTWNTAGHTASTLYTLEGGEGYSEGSATYIGHYVNTECIAREPADLLLEALDVLFRPPLGRESILRPEHTTVNIGISYDCRALALAIDLEGKYVTYLFPPTIQEGQLFMEGSLLNGATLLWMGLVHGIRIDYLPLPGPLTRGQLFRANNECLGIPVAAVMLRMPLLTYYEDLEEGFQWMGSCVFPHNVDPQSEPPLSEEEARQLINAAADFEGVSEVHSGPAILPDIWKVENGSFTIQADVTQVLADHGSGVYMINLLGEVDGVPVAISRYAIFVE